MDDKFTFRDFSIPVELMMMTGGGPDTFEIISNSHIQILCETVGLSPNHHILEVGCGIGRDAIPLTSLIADGSYIGIDIIEPSIAWCNENISRRHPNFSFYHLDIKDQLHNPNGTTTTRSCTLPAGDQSVDRIILWSVFTHMFRYDIVHYLDEFRRILKPGGRVFMTCFIADSRSLESVRNPSSGSSLTFKSEFGPGCYVNDLVAPAGAVAFTEQSLREMVAAAELSVVEPMLRGSWAGLADSKLGQDALILRP